MKIEFGPDFEKSVKRMIWRERLEPFNPLAYKRKLKAYHIRGKRGWANSDVWNFDSYLSEVIVGGLRHLRDKHVGYPDNPFHPTGMTDKKWTKILNDTARGFEDFEKLKNDLDIHPKSAEYKRLTRSWNKASKLFITYFGNFWD